MSTARGFCTSCGLEVVAGDRFCHACGAPITPPAPASPFMLSSQPLPGLPQDENPAGATFPVDQPEVYAERAPRRRGPWKIVAAIVVVALVAFGARQLLSSEGGGGADQATVDFNGNTVPLNDAPGGEPEERWTTDLDDADGVLAVAGGDERVFVAVIDGDAAEVVALSTGDGEESWRTGLEGDGTDVGLTVIGGRVIVSQNGAEDGSWVSALDAESGEEMWQEEFTESYVGVTQWGDDSVLVQRYDEESEVSLLSVADGDEQWSKRASAIAVDDDLVVTIDDGELQAESFGGDERWSIDLDLGDDEYPAVRVAGGHPVVAIDDEITSYARGDGEERWSTSSPVDAVYYLQLLTDGHIAAVGDGGTAVLDANGEVLWDRELSLSDVLVVDGDTYLLSDDGEELRVFEALTGERVGEHDLDDEYVRGEDGIIGNPLAAGGVLVRSGEPARVTVYDVPSLEERWSVRVDGDYVQGAAAVDGGLVTVDDELSVTFYR